MAESELSQDAHERENLLREQAVAKWARDNEIETPWPSPPQAP
jgi:hypothetical protein